MSKKILIIFYEGKLLSDLFFYFHYNYRTERALDSFVYDISSLIKAGLQSKTTIMLKEIKSSLTHLRVKKGGANFCY